MAQENNPQHVAKAFEPYLRYCSTKRATDKSGLLLVIPLKTDPFSVLKMIHRWALRFRRESEGRG